MNKGQSSLLLANILLSVILVAFSFLMSYAVPVLLLAVCLASGIFVMERKGFSGQAELAVSLALILVTAGSVVAYSTMNNTTNTSFTGNVVSGGLGSISSANSAEVTSSIEVWADSRIEMIYDFDTIVARLMLDDETPIDGGSVDMYVNDVETFRATTDEDGKIMKHLYLENGTHILEAEFKGRPEDYINPAYNSTEIEVFPGADKNLTAEVLPEIRITDVHLPDNINQSEKFELGVSIRSLHGNSSQVEAVITTPGGVSYGSEKKLVGDIGENETSYASWKLQSDSCGFYRIKTKAENAQGSSDTELIIVEVNCDGINLSSKQSARIGNLSISILNVSEDFYLSRDPETFERVRTRILALYVVVSNNFEKPSAQYLFEDRESISLIEIVSDVGEIPLLEERDMGKLRNIFQPLFGRAMDIHPQTSREGYILFKLPENSPDAIDLIIETNSGSESFVLSRSAAP